MASTNNRLPVADSEATGRSIAAPAARPPSGRIGMLGDMFRRTASHAGAHNFAWLTADRVLRVLVALVVSGLLARTLGQHDFGLFAYAVAWINIIVAVGGLGMEALVLRDIIRQPQQAGAMIGTAVFYRALASASAVAIIGGLVAWLRPGEQHAVAYVLLLGGGTVLQALESAELWFQSKTQMRRLIVPRLALFILFNAGKLWGLANGMGLGPFVILTAVEFATGGLLTYTVARWSSDGLGRMTVDWKGGRRILAESWPLAVSALVVIVYMRVSQLILAEILGDGALGVYTAAIRIVEVVNPIPLMLASSFLPSWLASRAEGPEVFARMRLRYFRISALLAYAWCVPVCVFAPFLVQRLFGSEYAAAADVLRLYAWTSLLVFMGVARTQHLLNERLTTLSLGLTIGGLAMNVALSFILIPRFGIMGAAWAVLVSYSVAAVGSSFLFARTREVGIEQVRALLTPWRVVAPVRKLKA